MSAQLVLNLGRRQVSRKLTCIVVLSLMMTLVFCVPILAANRSILGRRRRFFDESGGVGGTMGYLSVALIALIAAMGFVNASKRLMKDVKPATRKWLKRVHGFLGIAVLVTIIIHILTIGH